MALCMVGAGFPRAICTFVRKGTAFSPVCWLPNRIWGPLLSGVRRGGFCGGGGGGVRRGRAKQHNPQNNHPHSDQDRQDKTNERFADDGFHLTLPRLRKEAVCMGWRKTGPLYADFKGAPINRP